MEGIRAVVCVATLAALVCADKPFAASDENRIRASQALTITVFNDTGISRPSETIVVPFSEVKRRLSSLKFDQLVVRNERGDIIPSQVTAMRHIHQGPPAYDDLLFQHDFAPGEKRAAFTVEAVSTPMPPIASKVFARVVPERYDDFAWENDYNAHRAYGPSLELPAAAKDRLVSSGLDLWPKRVPYLVIDRWYRKGHDGLHQDTGEGYDLYVVGSGRGVGGTGVWDGKSLHVSKNWRTWAIHANGPVRATFDLGYEAWDAGQGLRVRETKRFIVDAGHALDEIHSQFDFTPSPGSDGTITVAIGLTEHPASASITRSHDELGRWMSVWEIYQDPEASELGTAVLAAPGASDLSFANTAPSANAPAESLMLVKVRPGETIRYFAGGVWKKAGHYSDAAQWNNYLSAWAARLATPVRLEFSDGALSND